VTARNHDHGDDDSDINTPSASPRYRTQAEFAAAVCRGESRALRELFLVYVPLLRDQARRLGIPPASREELVTTVLDDVVMHFQNVPSPPRVLGKYVVAALRNRVRNVKREDSRRLRRIEAVGEQSLEAFQSSYALRAANPEADCDEQLLRSAVAKLATHSVKELSEGELHLCVGMARQIPIRELAEQLGIAYGTARVRVSRLRDRLEKIIRQHTATLVDDERREVDRFIRRSGIDVRGRRNSHEEAP
jgi:DNA-directed RNA polymerase specialized sigma24 family protein